MVKGLKDHEYENEYYDSFFSILQHQLEEIKQSRAKTRELISQDLTYISKKLKELERCYE